MKSSHSQTSSHADAANVRAPRNEHELRGGQIAVTNLSSRQGGKQALSEGSDIHRANCLLLSVLVQYSKGISGLG